VDQWLGGRDSELTFVCSRTGVSNGPGDSYPAAERHANVSVQSLPLSVKRSSKREQTSNYMFSFLPLNPCDDLNKYGRELCSLVPIQPTSVSAYHAVHTSCEVCTTPGHGPGRQWSLASAGQPGRTEGDDQHVQTTSHLGHAAGERSGGPNGRTRCALPTRYAFGDNTIGSRGFIAAVTRTAGPRPFGGAGLCMDTEPCADKDSILLDSQPQTLLLSRQRS
jgi:hypothetical protein